MYSSSGYSSLHSDSASHSNLTSDLEPSPHQPQPYYQSSASSAAFAYPTITPSHPDHQNEATAIMYDSHQLQNGVGDPDSANGDSQPHLLEHSQNSASSLSLSNQNNDDFLLTPVAADQDAAQMRAIKAWTQRVTICFLAHMVTAICLLRSAYWLSTVCGCVILLAFYAYAHIMRIRRKNFVFLYLLVVGLNLTRDVIILVFYIPELEVDWWSYTLLVFIWIDAVVVTPLTCYTCFYLYRSTAVSQLSM